MKKLIILMMLMTLIIMSNLLSVSASDYAIDVEYTKIQSEQAYKIKQFNDFYEKERNNIFFIQSFGGNFFKEVTLFVNVTEGNEKEFRNRYSKEFDFEIQLVKYSYSELELVKNEIAVNPSIYKLRELSINVIENKVEISTELSVVDFDKLLSKEVDRQKVHVIGDFSVFEYNTRYTINGERYEVLSFGCTVGFAARDSNNDPGFVTAGHCMELSGASNGTNIYYDGDHAGDAVSGWHFEDGDVDGAFVELRDPWIGTTWLPTKNLVFGGPYYTVGSFSSYYAIGTNVRFHGTFEADGSRNTAVETGEITGNNIDVYDGSTLLYSNMFRTDIETHHGDSGGPLTITFYIGEGFYETNVIGVLSFSLTTDESYFSKASDILIELNLTAY